jgi:hypothetical protein
MARLPLMSQFGSRHVQLQQLICPNHAGMNGIDWAIFCFDHDSSALMMINNFDIESPR